MDCFSGNLLYVIRCEGCGEGYIGETGNELYIQKIQHCGIKKDHWDDSEKNPQILHVIWCNIESAKR